ncbi:hypothetical protein E2C01_092131 [Portunus trituberculatus]|uniref:Uncharacterized protein n=1 Tax=Portunus trituberculatus TaxID=210409 RepID=A0A5B7JKT1_PORTR|nr:hypothetical protein [Portunus trituberculatus]
MLSPYNPFSRQDTLHRVPRAEKEQRSEAVVCEPQEYAGSAPQRRGERKAVRPGHTLPEPVPPAKPRQGVLLVGSHG